MERVARRRSTAFRVLAAVFALGAWIPALGLPDLTASWFLPKTTIVHDLGYGAITGLIVPAGLLAQLRVPERNVASLQQVVAAGIAYGVAAAIGDRAYLRLAGAVLGAAAVLVALHPARGALYKTPRVVSLPLFILAVLATVWAVPYALDAAANQRNGVAPIDFHAHMGSWAGLTAMAIGIPLVATLASLRTEGWLVPGLSAAAAAGIFGLGSLLYPGVAGSPGRAWATLVLTWAALFAAVALREARRQARRKPGSLLAEPHGG